ncbi:hypothetical protein PtB15_5B176 [Puccinia triticina]|nr:hypothetical protein PtB15_5B176 [Puccinia triticina]
MRVFRLEQLKQQEEALKHKSPTPKIPSVPSDTNPCFTPSDYEMVCTYLETGDNYDSLFGEGGKLQSGRPMPKAAAFDLFASFMNQSNRRLRLTGRQLQQRLATYMRHKYNKAREFQNSAPWSPHSSPDLIEKINEICPCFQRLERILASANKTSLRNEPCAVYSTSEPPSTHLQNPRDSQAASERHYFHPIAQNGQEHTSPTARATDYQSYHGTTHYIDLDAQLSQRQPVATDQIAHHPNDPDSHYINPIAQSSRQPRTANTNSESTDESDHVERNEPVDKRATSKPRPRRTFTVNTGRCRTRPKITLAAAFDRNTKARFRHLDKRLVWEKKKFAQELELKKIELELRGNQIRHRSRLAERWLEEGKTGSEIQTLLSSIYATYEEPISTV